MPDSNNQNENEARLNLLYEIGRVLASAETMNEAAPQILEAICRRLRFDLGELWRVNKDEAVLTFENAWHYPSPRLEGLTARSREYEFIKGEGLPGEVWAQNAPVWIGSIEAENNLPRKLFVEELDMRSAFGFPIRLGEKLLGVFSFFSREARQPDEIFLRMFAAIGDNIGQFVERERIEKHLRQSEESYRIVAETASDAIIKIDTESKILFVNTAVERIFGYAVEEILGESLTNLIPEDLREQHLTGFRRYLETGERQLSWAGIEIPALHKDGHIFPMEISFGEFNQNSERFFIGIARDISRRKRTEAEREQLLESEQKSRQIAEAANRAKDEFIAVVSHELRSPLNAMLGWTRILQEQKPDEKTIEYALDVIVRNARSQSKLIEDLLDIARVGEKKLRLDLQPTELAPIINQAVEIIKPAATAKNIRITQSLDRTANFVVGDDERLRQIIENLLSNAVKFTLDGGLINVRLEREDNRAKIVVSDNGQGITPEFLPQIFELFKQADLPATRRHGGLGIGLSLARNLVELHGGAITATSAGEGRGATFIVRLPLREIAPIKENSSKVKFMDSQGKLSGFWILAVDDEADAREIVSFMLQINGAKVTTANSAVEAIDILKSSNGKLPDILLSDISMPNESGYALLEKIRALPEENGGRIPAVALTAFNRPEDRQNAFEAGFQKHLGKPVEMDDLISAIIETARAR
ncbi:MAG: PAS domain S-box protein [Pyrinomonadaceae bacterium]